MTKTGARLLFVDALRGVASVGVLLAHLVANEVSGVPLRAILPTAIKEFCFNGQFGVEVFFVLSGFVIALSLSHKPLDWPRARRFILRRQLRLDPPYFAALFGLMILHASFGRGWPRFQTLALNLVYAHNLAHVPQILGVAWTLCLEIQFYGAFLLLLLLDRIGRKGASPSRATKLNATISEAPISPTNTPLVAQSDAPFSNFAIHALWVSALASCFLVQIGTPWQLYAFGWGSWFYFAAGVLSCWCWRNLAPQWTLGVVMGGLMASALWSFTREASYVTASFEGIETGLITALLLFVGGRRGWLETLSLGRAAQFLGRVSYSLYLTHAFTIEALMWTTRAVWGVQTGAFVGFILAIPLALLVAQGFYRGVEKPAVRWAARFKTS